MKTQKYLVLCGLVLFIVLAAIAIPFARAQAMSDVPCDTTALINAIQNAVAAGGSQTLNLATNCTYTLTAVNNGDGTRDANGLPVIANSVNLTIVGNGATIQRDANAPQFRILSIDAGSTLVFSALTIRGGRGVDGSRTHLPGPGGGIYNRGTLDISYSNILENHAGDGLRSKQAGATGGGIFNDGTLILAYSNVASNVSGDGDDGKIGATGGDGGGIYNSGTATITNSAIYGNKSGAGGNGTTGGGGMAGFGAGIMHFEGQLILANSTVSGNKGGKGGKSDSDQDGFGGSGGGLAVWKGNVTITNSTIAKNKSGAPHGVGAGIDVTHPQSTAKLRNTIVADNAPSANCWGNIKNVANNLDTGASCGFGSGNDSKSNADPNLEPLASNGAGTLSHAFKKPSDAFNKGKDAICESDLINNQDQRGMTRSQGKHCDIGAFELQVSQPTPTATYTPTQTTTPPPSTATSTPTRTPSPTPTLPPSGSCAGPSNGRVSCWKGENNANDSISTNNGTVQGGATYATGKVGQAFSFNGTSGHILVPDSSSLDVTTQFTMSAWVNPAALMAAPPFPGKGAIISKIGGGGGNNGYQYGISHDNTKISCQFNAQGEPWPGNQLVATVPGGISLNTWTHIACTYNNANLTAYVNGAQVGTLAVGAKTVVNSASNLRISSDDNGNVYFDGLIDEAQVWNRALTAQEILDLYNAQ